MNSLALMAMNMIQNSPAVKNNPEAQQYIEVIKSGDDAEGQRLAEELCSKHGETPQSASTKAKRFFGL